MVSRQDRLRRDERGGDTHRRLRQRLRLDWPGRIWEPDRIIQSDSESSSQLGAPPLPVAITTELPGDGSLLTHACESRPIPSSARLGESAVRLVHGDALDVGLALIGEGWAGKVDLVYVDPPFASQAAYTYEARLDGPADGRILRSHAYDDRWTGDGIGPYLDMLAPRLEVLTRLLSPTGTLWVHVDYRASYLVRALLDEVMGREAFVNEIVWRRAPNLGRQAASRQFGRTLDTLVVYGGERATLTPPTRLEPIAPSAIRWDEGGRPFIAAPRGDYTDASIARLEAADRVHRTASGKIYVKYFLLQDGDGQWCRERRVDALWTDVPPLRHARTGERTGFPTQKPRALLDRVISCASPMGGCVVDLFSGSGTTGESAHALGRRCILADASAVSVGMARARLLRSGAPVVLQSCGSVQFPEASQPDVTVGGEAPQLHVELIAPREPLAWAIDIARQDAGPFRTAWHSERLPGARARGVIRHASFDHAPGPIGVRVWHDDGSVGSRIVGEP